MVAYRHRIVFLAFALQLAALHTASAVVPIVPIGDSVPPSQIGRLPIWDDGLSEMSYYDAERTIYGKVRKYTRVHMINRQWLDRKKGVKSEDRDSPDAAAVFKLHICEEVPTENYNYRFATTVFLDRVSLRPLKTVESSQEWCGTTYKHLRWTGEGLHYKSFSYFPDEGENEWKLDEDVWPFEASFILARELVAAGSTERSLSVLPPLQSNRQTDPKVSENATLTAIRTADAQVPAGRFTTKLVVLNVTDKAYRFWIETEAPYRLIKFESEFVKFQLRGVERRAYWDRNWKSRFHKPGQAP